MRTDLVVVSPPALDQDSGLLATSKPRQAQALVAKLVVEALVGRSLPRLAGVDVGGVDVGASQPLQDRPGDKLGPEPLQVYRRPDSVSHAVSGLETGSPDFAPPTLRPATPERDRCSPGSSPELPASDTVAPRSVCV